MARDRVKAFSLRTLVELTSSARLINVATVLDVNQSGRNTSGVMRVTMSLVNSESQHCEHHARVSLNKGSAASNNSSCTKVASLQGKLFSNGNADLVRRLPTDCNVGTEAASYFCGIQTPAASQRSPMLMLIVAKNNEQRLNGVDRRIRRSGAKAKPPDTHTHRAALRTNGNTRACRMLQHATHDTIMVNSHGLCFSGPYRQQRWTTLVVTT